MARSYFILLAAFTMSCVSVPADQASDLGVPGPLGEARIFLPGLLSRGNDYGVTFTPDQKEMYWVRRAVDAASGAITQRILVSRRAAEGWSNGEDLNLSPNWRVIGPFVTPDGQQLIFNSMEPRNAGDTKPGNFDILVAQRQAERWGAPLRLPSPVNTAAGEIYATATADGHILFVRSESMSAGTGSRLTVMRAVPRGDGYGEPEPAVGIPAGASAPYIAPDGSYLIFSAQQPGPNLNWDLYVSSANGEEWTAPRKLSPKVNSVATEISPSVSPDGKYLFFGRAVRPPGGTLAEEKIEIMVIEAEAEGL